MKLKNAELNEVFTDISYANAILFLSIDEKDTNNSIKQINKILGYYSTLKQIILEVKK